MNLNPVLSVWFSIQFMLCLFLHFYFGLELGCSDQIIYRCNGTVNFEIFGECDTGGHCGMKPDTHCTSRDLTKDCDRWRRGRLCYGKRQIPNMTQVFKANMDHFEN